MEEHISTQDRNADELKKENTRLRKTSKDLEATIASLRDSVRTKQRSVDEIVDQVRAERDSLQARLARLEPVSTLRKRSVMVIAILKPSEDPGREGYAM